MLIAFSAVLVAALPQEPVALHPQSAAITIQVADVQGLMAAYPKTAAALMMADPELQAAVGLMMAGEGAAPVDPLDLVMGQYASLVNDEGMPPFLEMASKLTSFSFSLDVPDGDIFAFIKAHEGLGFEEREAATADEMGLRFVADFVSEEAQAAASAAFAEMFTEGAPWQTELQPLSLTRDEAGAFGSKSVTVWSYASTTDEEMSQGMEVSTSMIAGGTRMAIVMGNVDTMDFVETLGTGAMEGNAMARFAAGRKSLGESKGLPVFEANLNPYIEKLMMDAEPMALPALDLAEGLLGPMASMIIRGGHWRLEMDPASGRFMMEGVHAQSKAGATAGLLGASPVDASALTLAHPDALVTTVTSLDKSVLVNLLSELEKSEDPNSFDQLDTEYGFRPDRDLAQPLGSAVSYSLPKLGTLLAAPNLMIAIDLDDKDGFIRGMDGFFKMAGAEAGEELQVTRETYKKISTLYKFSMPGLFEGFNLEGLPVNLSKIIEPTIAVLDDRVVITMNRSHARKEVRRVRNLLKAGGEPPVHVGLKGLGDLKGAATVSYGDWAGFVGGIYSQLKAFGPMLSGALPVDVTALPSSDVLTRHFQPSERRVRIVDGVVRHSSRSSFGPELSLLPPLALTLGVVPGRLFGGEVVEAQLIEPMPVDAVGVSVAQDVDGVDLATINTTGAFLDVAVGITRYQLDRGDKLPATLADLAKTSKEYPNGYLEGALPKDGWGNDLMFKVDGEEYILWSTGPDGVDQQGAGDDVVAD